LRNPKTGTIALVIQAPVSKAPLSEAQLLEQLSDDQEIQLLENAIQSGLPEPLERVYAERTRKRSEDEEFADYVENLLSQPFLRREVQDHGLQWLQSKIKIEKFLESEREATQVIAHFALQLFRSDPQKTEFLLSGPISKVRVKVFVIGTQEGQSSHSAA
jgi:hypothetical protein